MKRKWTHEKLMQYHIFRKLGVSCKTAGKAAIRGWKAK